MCGYGNPINYWCKIIKEIDFILWSAAKRSIIVIINFDGFKTVLSVCIIINLSSLTYTCFEKWQIVVSFLSNKSFFIFYF